MRPVLAGPADGATLVNDTPMLAWASVEGANRYRIQTASGPTFANPRTTDLRTTSLYGPSFEPDGTLHTVYWRVRVYGPDAIGPYSEAWSYHTGSDYTAVEFLGGGAGIVEVARPDRDACAGDDTDIGCQRYGGNTVFRNADISGDYYVSAHHPDYAYVLGRDLGVLYPGGSAEMRFTETGGLAVYATGHILSVPFELWNLGTEAGPADDMRMIPLIGTGEGTEVPELDSWADQFPGTEFSGIGGVSFPRTVSVSFMQPKPGGSYAAFEADALSFGGPGATYDSDADHDTEVAPDPTTGGACENQGFYIDFCYRNDSPYVYDGGSYIQPIRQAVIVDLAGDGTTPPAGTTIRFHVASPRFVDAAAAPPDALAGLGLPYPNPSRASARVPYETTADGPVRLVVVDLLGRTVAVLADGVLASGHHEAWLPAGLAPGVYAVVLDAGGVHEARRVTVVR